MARVVVVEPFHGGSHASWFSQWKQYSRHDLYLLSLPDQFWRWRMRGSSVTLGAELAAFAAEHGPPDALVVSDMVDAAGLLGMARRQMASVPVALYMHENQLLYPVAPGQRATDTYGLINWRSMNVADEVWFNSSFHRTALFEALPTLLVRQPDNDHDHLVAPIAQRSSVLWPGVDVGPLIAGERADRGETSRPLVLWNQRWDHDKNPAEVFAMLARLASEGVAFDLALAGETVRENDREMVTRHGVLADRIVHEGHLARADYVALLLRSDVIVSAADHEFFGIAIIEAIASGAVPVLPDRLSFPEIIEPQFHGRVLGSDASLEARLRAVLEDVPTARAGIEGLRASMVRFASPTSAAAHDDAVERLIRSGSAPTPGLD